MPSINRGKATVVVAEVDGTQLVVECPFCGEEHYHGGYDGTDPGLRLADCGTDSYYIVIGTDDREDEWT